MNNVIFNQTRMASRAPINTMDQATIFSIFPKDIKETKITLNPCNFLIPGGDIKTPGRLLVGTASWWRDVDPDQPLIEIPVSSVVVADSIVTDYAKGLYGYTVNNRTPGIFWVAGNISVAEVTDPKNQLNNRLKQAEREQKAWFEYLCTVADALWARSNGNPLAIMDDMKLAAERLGYDRDWMKNHVAISLVRCINCGELRNPQFPTCKHCHTVVDKALAAKLGLVAS